METPLSRVLAPLPLLIFGAAVPALAADVFLDHDTDNNPYTFENLVEGPISVPVSIVVSFTAADLGATSVSAVIQWGYTPPDPGGSQGCFDTKGSIGYVAWTPLPDQGPFTNVVPYSCVCKFRCSCDAQMFIQADVTGLTQPGNYVLATLDFSRMGYSLQDCGNPVEWPQSDFEAFCVFPNCGSSGDPRAKMTITDGATAVDGGVLDGRSSWGKVKALYR